jgi:hypothetical protein
MYCPMYCPPPPPRPLPPGWTASAAAARLAFAAPCTIDSSATSMWMKQSSSVFITCVKPEERKKEGRESWPR